MIREILTSKIERALNVKSSLAYVSNAVTWKCNSRCSTCGIWNSPHNNGEMTLWDYARILDDPLLSHLKVWEMTGGEPMLYPHIKTLTEIAFDYLPKTTQIRIGTNCIATKKLIDLLSTFKDRPLYLSLSIDGLEEKHDEIRGVKGNFSQVLEVIECIRRLQHHEGSKLEFGASVCVSKLNIDQIPELTEWLNKQNIPFQLTPVVFPPYAQKNYARKTREELDFITQQEKAKAIGIFSRYEKLTYRIFCKYWADMPYPIAPCYALRKYMHTRPDGDVEICMWKPIVIGNLKKQTLSQIWYSPFTNKIRRLVRKCTECARVHPNLCDALNNYYFNGTLIQEYLKGR